MLLQLNEENDNHISKNIEEIGERAMSYTTQKLVPRNFESGNVAERCVALGKIVSKKKPHSVTINSWNSKN